MTSVPPGVAMQALRAVHSVRNFAEEIGASPQNPDGTIKGAETDEFHKKVHPSILDVVGIAGSEYVHSK